MRGKQMFFCAKKLTRKNSFYCARQGNEEEEKNVWKVVFFLFLFNFNPTNMSRMANLKKKRHEKCAESLKNVGDYGKCALGFGLQMSAYHRINLPYICNNMLYSYIGVYIGDVWNWQLCESVVLKRQRMCQIIGIQKCSEWSERKKNTKSIGW